LSADIPILASEVPTPIRFPQIALAGSFSFHNPEERFAKRNVLRLFFVAIHWSPCVASICASGRPNSLDCGDQALAA